MSPAPARVAAALGLAALIQLIFPLATAIAQPIPQTTDLIPYPVTSADDVASHATLVEWLRERRVQIGDVRKVNRDRLVAVFREVDSALVGGEFFRDHIKESPHRPEALSLLTRFQFLNLDRYMALADYNNEAEWGLKLSEVEKEILRNEYFAMMQGQLAEALTLKPTGSILAGIHETQGEILVRAFRPKEAIDAFTLALRADPGGRRLDELYIKLNEACFKSEDYGRAERVCLEAVARFPTSNLWPHFFWFYHKALRHQGKIEQALAGWEQILPRMTAGGEGEPLIAAGGFVVPDDYRIDYERYAGRAEFYRGFYLYALGRVEEAQKALQNFSDRWHAHVQSGGEIPMDLRTYLDFQADPMERRISLLQGQPLPEFTDGMSWLIPPSEANKAKKGKLRFFAGSQRVATRQRKFMDTLKNLESEFADRGVAVEWVGLTLHPGAPLERERQGVYEQIEKHQIQHWTVGVDVGGDGAHNGHHIVTGGVTLIVSDADGNVAWQLIDPMYWDEALIRRVLERLFPE